MLSRVSAGDLRPNKQRAQDGECPVAVVPNADALGRRHSLCGLASVTSTTVAGYADPVVNGSDVNARLCATRHELPILRAKYVARGVRVLAGSRWRLNRFQERTIVLRTGADPTVEVFDASFDVDRPGVLPEATYALAVDTTCELTGPSGGRTKPSLATGIQLLSVSSALRLRIRLTTAADASIWRSIVRDALTHARWSRDVRPIKQDHPSRGQQVRVVQHACSSKRFVVKVIAAATQQGDCHELQILRRLYKSRFAQDTDLIRGYRVVETLQETLLVMPQLPGITLLHLLRERRRQDGRKLSEEEAWRLLGKLAARLQTMHRSGVTHGDLNLENVLVTLDISDAWIIDFGGAYSLLDGGSTSGNLMIGTPGFIAPERVQDPISPPTPQADIFSLGILMFQALTGQHPYIDASSKKCPLSLSDSLGLDWDRAEKLLPVSLSKEIRKLVGHMLVADPLARTSLVKVLAASCR
ncbi:unnamed protein product [Phytophthora fragariaefolia]|uniref:non-specific serine/threonine protein kinase n=1 Tax=Phytophthora fragariaefolia TaxID=1490495 RepID=A0A9W6XQX3_9STRA|nr:unnamed protein product [Phytophthora fragariaefolia]